MAGDLNVEPSGVGWLTAAWTAIGATLGAALGAFGLWLANRTLGKAAFQTAINTGFKELLDQLQEERQAMLAQMAAERRAANEERIEAAKQSASLHGQINNLTQAVESLEALLRRHGIPVPSRRPPATVENPPTPMVVLDPEGGDL